MEEGVGRVMWWVKGVVIEGGGVVMWWVDGMVMEGGVGG